MIIVPEKAAEHGKPAEAKVELEENTDSLVSDPPPTYASTSSPRPEVPRSVVPKTKPTNYLLIDRANNPVKGTYTIDPFMSIPQSFLPQLAAGETESGRKNLKVWSKNGSVDIDVTLLADSTKHGVDGKKRATLDVGSQNGSINIKLHRIDTGASGIPLPFQLNVAGHNGSITIGLPRTFEGLLTIFAKNGCVKISDEITQQIAMHSEEKHTHRCFVGDMSLLSSTEAAWAGDKLNVDAHNGRVKVYFVDEEAGAGKSTSMSMSGFWSHILGI